MVQFDSGFTASVVVLCTLVIKLVEHFTVKRRALVLIDIFEGHSNDITGSLQVERRRRPWFEERRDCPCLC